MQSLFRTRKIRQNDWENMSYATIFYLLELWIFFRKVLSISELLSTLTVFIDLIKWKANYIISFQSLGKSTKEKTPQILSAIPEYVIQNFPFCLKGYMYQFYSITKRKYKLIYDG